MSAPAMVLDQVMPYWTSTASHKIVIPPTNVHVLTAVDELTWSRVPLFHRLVTIAGLGIRQFDADDRVLDVLLHGPYAVIYRSDAELVVGGILDLTRIRADLPELGDQPIEAFRALGRPGQVKVALNFHRAGDVLSTHTRNLPIGLAARVAFGSYWLAIRAGSGLIRRSWLRGVHREILQRDPMLRDRAARQPCHLGPPTR